MNVPDFVIIGSGIAGTAAALRLAEIGSVAVVTKTDPFQSNSAYAQGGIAAAVGPADTPHLHAADTMAAGGGLCNEETVTQLTETAPSIIRWLLEQGVQFDADADGNLNLGLEGAHVKPRILHIDGDSTGRGILAPLLQKACAHANITWYTSCFARMLLKNRDNRVIGVRLSDTSSSDELTVYARRGVVLATGGVGQLFGRTTNPLPATGDGLALAIQAGACLRDLEYIQFHPTALAVEGVNPAPLISEAVRGAGAYLVDETGRRILLDYKERELAARDVVSRRIYHVLQLGHTVYLDTRHINDFKRRFPSIDARCRELGFNPETDLLPVSPAAHFMMGGVEAGLDGATSVPGLFAVGEVACTGVHGANRLASNSLLECLVMAHQLGLRARDTDVLADNELHRAPSEFEGFEEDTVRIVQTVGDVLWRHCGILRDAANLELGLKAMNRISPRYPNSPSVLVAETILSMALCNPVSRGAHYRTDDPKTRLAPLVNA